MRDSTLCVLALGGSNFSEPIYLGKICTLIEPRVMPVPRDLWTQLTEGNVHLQALKAGEVDKPIATQCLKREYRSERD